MLISPAYAQAEGMGGFDPMAFLPLVLIFVVFYFLLIRPQQKRQKEQKAKIAAIRRGDRVVTAGGLIATVVRVVDENEVVLEIAQNTRVRAVRSTIGDILTKGEPVADGAKGDK
jgi:preprotein translocase subunit YajC